MPRKPNYFQLKVAYNLFMRRYGDEFKNLTFPMQCMLVGDYLAWVLDCGDMKFEHYIMSRNEDWRSPLLKEWCKQIIDMHLAWGVEA